MGSDTDNAELVDERTMLALEPQYQSNYNTSAEDLVAEPDSDRKQTLSLQEYVDTRSRGELPEVVKSLSSIGDEEAEKDSKLITFERVKIAIILVILLASAVAFAFCEEEEDFVLHLASVAQSAPLTLALEEESDMRTVFEAIISLQEIPPANSTNYIYPNTTYLYINLQGSNNENGPWTFVSDEFNATAETEQEVQEFHDFFLDDSEDYEHYQWLITTNSEYPIGITFQYRELFSFVAYEVLIAAVILVGVYIIIVFELLHRTLAALMGAFISVAVLSIVRGRPSFIEVITWIDWDTIGLLFGMMIMVGIFSETGFFEYCAVKAYKWSKGNLWYLTLILCLFTAVISAFLDNVTTILLLTPVTVRLCRVLDIRPEPILLAEVMLSNIGGTATPIGDPPNIIIVNNADIQDSGEVSFFTFVLHMTPGVVCAAIVVFIGFYFVNKRKMARVPHKGKEKEIEIWKQTAGSIEHWASKEDRRVQEQLMEYIKTLEAEAAMMPDDDQVKDVDISELEKTYYIHDKTLFISSMTVLTGVIIMFFCHSFVEEWIELSLAWIAIIGALIHLLVSGIHDLEEVLEKVEWATLLFFAGLFILMRGLEELGLIEWIGEQVTALIELVPVGNARLAAALMIILWVSALVSAFIDNIPYTAAMVPVVVALADDESLCLPLSPMVWALSFGTCFGGNGTLIGASANVVAVGLAEAQGYVISFNTFFKTGFPVMIVSVSVASVYLLLTHVLIPWYTSVC
mmetsp:Transcript_231/g.796  ORF Transcript_231/g.796 Transcript_231/m.796 type:complete len:745 (+) Transcript_231:60-2294(+)